MEDEPKQIERSQVLRELRMFQKDDSLNTDASTAYVSS